MPGREVLGEIPQPYTRPVDSTDALVERSGSLQRQLLEFAKKPRFDKQFRREVRKRFGKLVAIEDDESLYAFYDWFIQEFRLHDGRTLIDCYLETQRNLPDAERSFLLGWRKVREGLFEVIGRDGVALLAENLIDEMSYRIRADVGPKVFDRMPPGSFIATRVVPVNDEWLISGPVQTFPAIARDDVLHAAAQLAASCPDLVFHNPDKVTAGWQQQRDQHAAFVRHFGTDEVTVSVDELPTVMAGFWQTYTDGASTGPDTDTDWLHISAETVGIIFDETAGLGMYADYALAQEAFDNPVLMRKRRYKETTKSYLDDDSVDPIPLQRLAARHPTKTKKSRRTLAIPARCVVALCQHQNKQKELREKDGKKWHDDDLVFSTRSGAELDAANVRRGFRPVARRAGIDAENWTPRELRHSFVSLLSANGMSIETIADLMGHAGTRVTEAVNRHQLRPVLLGGEVAMDQIFEEPEDTQEA